MENFKTNMTFQVEPDWLDHTLRYECVAMNVVNGQPREIRLEIYFVVGKYRYCSSFQL